QKGGRIEYRGRDAIGVCGSKRNRIGRELRAKAGRDRGARAKRAREVAGLAAGIAVARSVAAIITDAETRIALCTERAAYSVQGLDGARAVIAIVSGGASRVAGARTGTVRRSAANQVILTGGSARCAYSERGAGTLGTRQITARAV